jgi:hypothetical protein
MEHPFVPNSFPGKRKTTVANPPQVHPHGGSRAVHEYQFLPEQPSDTYDRASRSHYYDTPVEASNSRVSSLNPGSHLLHGSEEMAPGYTFEGQGLLPQSGRPQVFPAVPTDYEANQSNSNLNSVPTDGQFGISEVAGFEDPLVSSETRAYHDEDASRVDRKRKVCFSLTSYMHLVLQPTTILNLSDMCLSIMRKQKLQRKLKLMKDELGRSLRSKIF